MKYIIEHKSFKTKKEIEADIREICYDITDYYGFEVGFIHNRIIINKPTPNGEYPKEYFKMTPELSDVLHRIKDYLGEQYVTTIYGFKNNDYKQVYDDYFDTNEIIETINVQLHAITPF